MCSHVLTLLSLLYTKLADSPASFSYQNDPLCFRETSDNGISWGPEVDLPGYVLISSLHLKAVVKYSHISGVPPPWHWSPRANSLTWSQCTPPLETLQISSVTRAFAYFIVLFRGLVFFHCFSEVNPYKTDKIQHLFCKTTKKLCSRSFETQDVASMLNLNDQSTWAEKGLRDLWRSPLKVLGELPWKDEILRNLPVWINPLMDS